jgi:putative ABC transport system permease protein
MTLFTRVPLAWRNLVHDKRRFVVSVAGVGCAVLLMFMQWGFRNALLDSSVQLILGLNADQGLNADVILVSEARYYLTIPERFSIHRLEQAKAVPGVVAAYPLYLEPNGIMWRDPEGGPISFRAGEPSARPIRVIAFNPDYPVLRDPEVQGQLSLLRLPNRVLLDRRSKPSFGKRAPGLERELANRKIYVVGTFALGTDFTSDGTVIMSDRTYAELLADQMAPVPPLLLADVGLIQVDPGVSPAQVRDQLNAILPTDVHAMTLAEFASQEQAFWQAATPIGLVFFIGMVMGFIVGAVICFQILSADVADHLKEYATLKAIGYRVRDLYYVILTEAFWLTLLAYGPALVVTEVLYWILGSVTGLPLFLNFWRCAFVFALTAGMCMMSGVLAVQKIRTADPAEVF